MQDMQAGTFWLIPLDRIFSIVTFLVGVYSVTINVADAKRLHHPRAEQVSRIGGWCCMAAALGILIAF